MSYLVMYTCNNGYRCSCCQQSWTDSHWADTLAEAEEGIPDMPETSVDHELKSVSVTDGNTGEEVAWGRLLDTSGYYKYSGYQYSRWSGWKGGEPFEVILGRDGKVIADKTWDECVAEVKAKGVEQRWIKAERKLKEAQTELATLTESSLTG